MEGKFFSSMSRIPRAPISARTRNVRASPSVTEWALAIRWACRSTSDSFLGRGSVSVIRAEFNGQRRSPSPPSRGTEITDFLGGPHAGLRQGGEVGGGVRTRPPTHRRRPAYEHGETEPVPRRPGRGGDRSRPRGRKL